MMAMRFRSMGLVAAVALAALGCYMVSLRVAAERFALVRMEGRILAARQDIRRLQTEMGTRGRLVQLERWNSDVLALSAPKATQYLDGEFQLANYAQPAPSGVPAVIEARAAAPAPAAPKVVTVSYPAAAIGTAPAQPLLHDASYVKLAGASFAPQKVALQKISPPTGASQKVALLDDGLLGEIGKAAAAEAADSRKRR